ncbi:MAG: alpha/beta hydrolase [Pirellulales bacterium]
MMSIRIGWCLIVLWAMVGTVGIVRGQATNADAKKDTASREVVEVKPPIVLGRQTVSTLNVDYVGQGNPQQTLDIYSPKGVANAPVFVFVHGGGWNKRDKDEVGSQPKLFNDSGVVVVSINYRLVPAIRHPENVRDVAAAIAWMTQNIAKYGGDPKKIVLMGHSAGSHLVALVATDDRYLAAHQLHRHSLAGVICLDGSAFDIPDRIQNGAATIAENCRRAFGESLEAQQDGSPVHHVKGNHPLPPFLLVYLKPEALNHKQSARFAELVRGQGGSAKLVHINDGKSHQALCDDLGTDSDSTGPMLIEFVREVTK